MMTLTIVLILSVGLLIFVNPTFAVYKIGVGRADVTGPAAEVTFMGYAKLEQKGKGIHLRQFARTFIVDDGNARIVFVSVDAGMMGQGVRMQVIKNLQKKYDTMYSEKNVIVSGTHTHSGPAGFLMDLLFDISSLGFVRETFVALVTGITKSIERAHDSMTSGRIFVSNGELLDANINRSPTSYLRNPEDERAQYKYNVDKEMVQLKFVNEDNKIFGVFNWFAVHATSMNNTNKLISSDNVGYASLLLEQKLNPGNLTGRGPIVAAFASSNLGDVSPNIRGPRCEFSGVPCDGGIEDECPIKKETCFASGPGVDMMDSTKIIATRLFTKAEELLTSEETTREVTGPLKVIHQYVDMPKQVVPVYNEKSRSMDMVRGCLPAMGYSFAAGTTDGPGAFSFRQGTTSSNELWNMIRDFIAAPTEEDVLCQGAKPILLATGQRNHQEDPDNAKDDSSNQIKTDMNFPYEWQPRIVTTQVAMIGDFVLAAVPGEFTTMSGRRLRKVVRETILENGGPENVRIVVAGLSNIYSDYIVTPEEYGAQRYEAASTIFGPHTLTIYLNQYKMLAEHLMKGEDVEAGPTPPDLSKDLITLVPPVLFDSTPWRKEYGDCVLQPDSPARPGDVVKARFVSGHPRNDRMQERTFLTIERNQGIDDWVVVATDADWETQFIWERKSLFGNSEVLITWQIKPETTPGEYRIHHYGHYKTLTGGIYPYEGVSNSFHVI